MSAFTRKQNVQFMTTLSIVNAIISVGNNIISAISGGSSSGGSDNLKKTLDSLKDLLLPEDESYKKLRDKKVINKLEAELARGPFKVRPMATSSKSRGRIRRRRSDVNGPKQPEQS